MPIFYDDDNQYCNDMEWELYENGVRKTTGFSIGVGTGNSFINVTWTANSGTALVKARGKNPFFDGVKIIDCFSWQNWRELTITLDAGMPYFSPYPSVICTRGVNYTFGIGATCPALSYDIEAPAGWSINNGGNTLPCMVQPLPV
jgi:hypothetical protein